MSMFSPETKTIDAVKSWLVSAGIPQDTIHLRQSQGWIAFETTAGPLETLLNTKYHEYGHNHRQGTYVGTHEYKLPFDVAEHIDFITPGVNFASKVKIIRAPRAVPVRVIPEYAANSTNDCVGQVTPECIRARYNIPLGTESNKDNNLGIYEIPFQEYSQEDLDTF